MFFLKIEDSLNMKKIEKGMNLDIFTILFSFLFRANSFVLTGFSILDVFIIISEDSRKPLNAKST